MPISHDPKVDFGSSYNNNPPPTNKIMIERPISSASSSKRIGACLLPLQVFLLILSGFFVMMQISELPSSSSRRLRQLTSATTFNFDPQQRKAVVEDLQKLYEGSKLDKSYVHDILQHGKQLLSEVDSIYDLSLPRIERGEDADSSRKGITVVGDIHADFSNMIHLFKVNGFPSLERPYIFNGDMTDKGEQSLECLLGLLLIKRYCNECMYLHVGNHETRSFYKKALKTQVMTLYDEETYELVRDVLLELPLGAVVDDRILVIHGGIPYNGFDLTELRHYKRGRDIDRDTVEGTLFHRAVWADPTDGDDDWEKPEDNDDDDDDEEGDDDDDDEDDIADKKRGHFTSVSTESFLKKNNLEYIIRAHQKSKPGFQHHHGDKVITIHSSPKAKKSRNGSYLNIYSNDGSMHIEQFIGGRLTPEVTSLNHRSQMDWRALSS